LRGLTLLRKIPLEKLVTHRFPLEQINEALIAAERQETLKAAIVP
jgi:Zn-dependent alcohol dehydrogenase